ncbi:MAG: hypothetical protein WBX15_01790 [Thermoanaerobaculia bacterium]
MDRLIEWDRIEVRLRGEKLAAAAGEIIRGKRIPIRQLTLQFLAGELKIEGTAQKGIPIPFRLSIRRIEALDGTLRVPLESMSAFGFLPVPKLLLQIVDAAGLMKGGISIDPRESTIVIRLAEIVPGFVDVEIEKIRLVDGGVEVKLGRGGADLPEGFHG